MKTYCMNSKTFLATAILLLSFALLQSSCSDISTGEAVGIVFGLDSSPTTSASCEVDLTQPSVKWDYKFNDGTITVAAEVAGVIIVFNREANSRFNVMGFDKQDGRLLWTNDNLPTVISQYPRTFSGSDYLLIYKKDRAVALDAKTGTIRKQLALPFAVIKIVGHNDDFYMLPDPCETDETLGIYKWSNSDHRGQINLIYDLKDWMTHSTHFSNLSIGQINATKTVLITGATFEVDNEYTHEILAINLEDERLLWSDSRIGFENGFGSKIGYQIYNNQLLVGRRRALSMLSLESGELLWENTFGEEGFYNTKAYFNNGLLFIHDNYQSQNYCFDVNDGSIRWNYNSYGERPIFFKGEQMIWGGLEDRKGLAYVSRENGSVGETLENPWDTCSYAYFKYSNSAQDQTTTIIASDEKRMVGLAY